MEHFKTNLSNIRRALKYTGYQAVGTLATVYGHRLRAPVFIIGTGRCGSSLLFRIMNTHPQLTGFPYEANRLWHPNLYPIERKSFEAPTMLEDPKGFTKVSIKNWPNNHIEKIRRVFLGFLIIKGLRKILFVKSAMISFMIPKILAIFPDAKFIHIYRNGPSVIASLLKKEWKHYRDYFDSEEEYLFYAAKYWRDCLLEIEKQKIELKLQTRNAFLEFSYEELCESPIKVLDNIARFLSVDVDGFKFDTTQIISQNFKVGDYTQNKKWAALLELMSPAMKLKGYI